MLIQKNGEVMKWLSKKSVSLCALVLSVVTARPCTVTVRVACPNDTARAGILVCILDSGCALTDDLGIATIPVGAFGNYTVCVDPLSLPAGATLNPLCQRIKVESDAPPTVNFDLGGDFCSTPPPPGPCWLTGGGTIAKTKGTPNYSFGGVVYPGCSPKAADGGNWNVVDHFTGLHFQGQRIIVDSCSGVPTSSPKVTVNVIDFHGEGVVSQNGVLVDDADKVDVTFEGRCIDNKEGGAGADMIYLKVMIGSTVVMQIGSAAAPVFITTGNLQIHQTSCNN